MNEIVIVVTEARAEESKLYPDLELVFVAVSQRIGLVTRDAFYLMGDWV